MVIVHVPMKVIIDTLCQIHHSEKNAMPICKKFKKFLE